MEYRLNHIETDVRKQIDDKTKEGKVHAAGGIKITKDKNPDDKERNTNNYRVKKPKKKFIVSAEKNVKVQTLQIDAFKEEKGKDNKSIGVFLDVTK